MYRAIVMGVAIALLMSAQGFANTGPTAVAGAAPSISPLQAEIDLLNDAAHKFDNNDTVAARRQIDAVVASPSFGQLSPSQQHIALYLLGYLQVNAGEKEALATWKRATAMTDFASGRDWHLRLQADGQASDDADALQTLTSIAQHWPGSLTQVSDQYIRDLISRTRSQKQLADSRFELLLALKAAFWVPTDAFNTAEYDWVELVRELLARGRVQEAKAAAESIALFGAVNEMVLAKQFDPVTQADPQRFDLRSAMDHELDQMRAAVKANPESLEGVNELAGSLIGADQPQAALQLLDAAIARAKLRDSSAKPFSDPGELNWTYNQRALALLHLGRVDEAINLMKLGAERPEGGNVNVSQQLNLAQIYEEEGRPAEAMAVIADGESWDLSPYGKMDFEGVRACAAAQLHDQAALRRSMAYVRAHVDDAPGWAIDASICIGDMDLAAKTMITELANPNQLASALLDLQEGSLAPSLSPIVRDRKTQLWALYQRPDVKTAADAVGHHVSSPFQMWGMGR